MKELQDLIAAWRAMPPGAKAVLATVVATTGSTYRKAGARMLVTESGWAAGSVSGGCLESDVLTTAWDRTESGPALVTYDSTAADDIVWGFGLGCQGSVTVLFERLGPDGGPLPFLARCIEERVVGVIATVIADGPAVGQRSEVTATSQDISAIVLRAQSLIGARTYAIEDGVLFEPIAPPLALTVFGAGHDAIPLVAAAVALGWFVTVVDHRQTFADATRFPGATVRKSQSAERHNLEVGSVAVVMTHNYERDLYILRELLPQPLAYVGQLGPRIRTDRMLAAMAEEGYAPNHSDLAKLYAPIGLNLGAGSPEEIALAIVAEIQSVVNGRDAVSLRSSFGPLHEGEPCPVSR